MPVDRALPAALDPRSRLSSMESVIGGRTSLTLPLGLPAVMVAVVVLAFVAGVAYGGPLARQAQASQSAVSDSARGVPQDRSQAAAWYRKAAEQGDARAQFNLGLMYRYGPGYSPDLERWVEVFSPEPGHARPTAQGNPAVKYGAGVPRDHIEAHKWMSLAAARATGEDQQRFASARDSLAKIMTPEQIAEAQKRAAEWTAAFEKRKK